MPQPRTSVRARRKKLFTRTTSTFINNNSKPDSSILGLGRMLHSKSTYFYRWGSRLNYVVPSVCTLALLIGGIITINPTLNSENKASADDIPVGQNNENAVGIEFTEGAPSQQTRVEAGVATNRSNAFKVTGSKIYRYIVTLSTANGGTGELKGRDNPHVTIDRVADNTKMVNFPDNTWGYAFSDEINNDGTELDYHPVPSGMSGSSNMITLVQRDRITTDSIEDNYKLFFAAKLSSGLPADHYEANVYLSVVADSSVVASLGFTGNGKTITKMQEMTSDICGGVAKSDINTQHQLIDERDGKVYWISRLEDGNCWMTQNLDFDVDDKILTPADSNVAANIDTSNITVDQVSTVQKPNNIIKVSSPSSWPRSGNTYKGYYDPGDFYYDGPGNQHSEGKNCYNATGLGACDQFSQFGEDRNYQKDLHYHVGNYYSYPAATLGSKDGQTSGEAPMSICPKGWKLPTSNNTSKDSFLYLLQQYGVQSSPINGNQAIYKEPLYFVYGGYLLYGNLGISAGSAGLYWSSTPRESYVESAHYLFFSSNVSPSADIDRSSGLSIRCIAE